MITIDSSLYLVGYDDNKVSSEHHIRYDEKIKRYSSQFKARIVEQESYINMMRLET